MVKVAYGARITATSDAVRDHYCFYVQEKLNSFAEQHDDKAGAIYYAGVCKLRDALISPDAYQNTYWRENTTDDVILRTTIMCSSINEIEMFHELSAFVKTHRPIANISGAQMTYGRAMITCLEGPNKGKTYKTQDQCALENGVSQPTLSNHLNGKRGYENIRGMKFKRGIA